MIHKAPDPRHGKQVRILFHTTAGPMTLQCRFQAYRYESPVVQVMEENKNAFRRSDVVLVKTGEIMERIVHNKRYR